MVMVVNKARVKELFFPVSNKRIAAAIDITSPHAFKRSIKTLEKGGMTAEERKALVLARTRSKLQLRRRNLSMKERRQFSKIAKTDIPSITRRR